MRLMRAMRENIINGTFIQFVKAFMKEVYPDLNFPNWIMNSLQSVGINLLD